MAAPEAAIKNRIISHMNRDHTREQSYYLRHYARTTTSAASSPEMRDVDLNGMRISARGRDYNIPFEPALTGWTEVKGRIIEMAHTARDALGLSDIIITSYTPPQGFGIVVFGSVVFYFVCAATLRWIDPGSPVWPFLQAYFPGGPEWYQWVVKTIFWPVVVLHLFECYKFDGRLKKHGVEKFSGVWWAWQVTCFFEGYPSFQRLDNIVAKAEEKNGKKS